MVTFMFNTSSYRSYRTKGVELHAQRSFPNPTSQWLQDKKRTCFETPKNPKDEILKNKRCPAEGLTCTRREQFHLQKKLKLLCIRELWNAQRSHRTLASSEANSPFLLLVLLVLKPQLVLEYPVVAERKTHQDDL